MTSPWAERLAEVWASPGKAGSGVVVGDDGVLTARHVVAGALEGGETLARVVQPGPVTTPWTAMRVKWEDARWDLALLVVDSQVDGGDGRANATWRAPASPSPVVVRLGTAAERDCETVGFPDAEVQRGASGRPADAVRQSEQAVGTLLPAGQAKPPQHPNRPLPSRWMPFDVDIVHPQTGAGWQGISGGGVVLPDGRLVGVVVAAESEHDARRLYVVPLAEALDASTELVATFSSLLGQPIPVKAKAAPLMEDILQEACLGEDGLPVRVREAGLSAFGVKEADVLGEPTFLNYVPRDDDQTLEEAVEQARSSGRMLLVVGGSASGKSRSTAQLARVALANHRLLCPQRASFTRLHELPLDTLKPALVWLDDVEGYAPGFRDVVRRLLRSGVVVIGTIRRNEFEKRMPKSDFRDPLGEALSDRKLVVERPWKLDWSEQERARVVDHVKNQALLQWVVSGGSPSVWCVAGGELIKKLDQAESDDVRPCRYQLVRIVLDWSRTDIGEAIPIKTATGLLASYQSQAPDFEEVGEALQWALDPVVGAGRRTSQSLLSEVPSGGLIVHDYVQDMYARTADSSVPDAVWRSALDAAGSDENRRLAVCLAAVNLAITFEERGQIAAADATYRVALAQQDRNVSPWAALNLGRLHHKDAEKDSAEEAYRLTIDYDNRHVSPYAMFNLGLLYETHGDIDAAKAAYQQAIDTDHREVAPHAAFELGRLLQEHGEIGSAKAVYGIAIASNNPDWAPPAALGQAEVLKEAGEIDAAKAAYQQAIESHHPKAAALAGVGLGDLLENQGEIDAAKEAYRQALEYDDPDASQIAEERLRALG